MTDLSFDLPNGLGSHMVTLELRSKALENGVSVEVRYIRLYIYPTMGQCYMFK